MQRTVVVVVSVLNIKTLALVVLMPDAETSTTIDPGTIDSAVANTATSPPTPAKDAGNVHVVDVGVFATGVIDTLC